MRPPLVKGNKRPSKYRKDKRPPDDINFLSVSKKAGFSAKRPETGAVTSIQRFGGALNLNIHFDMPFLDGA
jgi:hypothetical protein